MKFIYSQIAYIENIFALKRTRVKFLSWSSTTSKIGALLQVLFVSH